MTERQCRVLCIFVASQILRPSDLGLVGRGMTAGADVGAAVETLISIWTKLVGATKASASSVTPSSFVSSAARSGPVTASVRSATRSVNTLFGDSPVGCPGTRMMISRCGRHERDQQDGT